jgi:uncharacterized DUF497 family protein
VRFEWDTEKEKANFTKHGVDFTEATAAFYDPMKDTVLRKRDCFASVLRRAGF